MTDTAIAIAGLTHRFGQRTAVDNLQIEVPTGAVCGFLGRNGAGKTTTINILMNLLQPTAGQVEVLGLDPGRDSLALWRQVGYVAENPILYGWMKVRELIWFHWPVLRHLESKQGRGLHRPFRLGPGTEGQASLSRHERPTGLGLGPRARAAAADPRRASLGVGRGGAARLSREHHRADPRGGAHRSFCRRIWCMR